MDQILFFAQNVYRGRIPDFPINVSWATASTVYNSVNSTYYVVVAGGIVLDESNGIKYYNQKVYALNCATEKWEEKADLPVGISHGFSVGKDKYYYLGGGVTGDPAVNNYALYRFNIETNSWAQMGSCQFNLSTAANAISIPSVGFRVIDPATQRDLIYWDNSNYWSELPIYSEFIGSNFFYIYSYSSKIYAHYSYTSGNDFYEKLVESNSLTGSTWTYRTIKKRTYPEVLDNEQQVSIGRMSAILYSGYAYTFNFQTNVVEATPMSLSWTEYYMYFRPQYYSSNGAIMFMCNGKFVAGMSYQGLSGSYKSTCRLATFDTYSKQIIS